MLNGLSKEERSVPKSIKECYKPSRSSECLWYWAETVEKIGFIVLFILVVVGIYETINNAIDAHHLLKSMDDVVLEEMKETTGYAPPSALEVLIRTAFRWGMYITVEFLAYNCLASLLDGIGNIVQSNRVSENVLLYNAAKAENYVEEPTPAKPIYSTSEENDIARMNEYKRYERKEKIINIKFLILATAAIVAILVLYDKAF